MQNKLKRTTIKIAKEAWVILFFSAIKIFSFSLSLLSLQRLWILFKISPHAQPREIILNVFIYNFDFIYTFPNMFYSFGFVYKRIKIINLFKLQTRKSQAKCEFYDKFIDH